MGGAKKILTAFVVAALASFAARTARAAIPTTPPPPPPTPVEVEQNEDALFGHEYEAEHENAHALPCRPTIACTADIVPAGDLEIESGFLAKRQRDGETLTAPLLVKYSLSHALQFQLGSNTLTAVRTTHETTYFDNVVGVLKLHIVDQTYKRPALALSAGLSVPTVHANGYARAYDGVFTAYVTKDVGFLHFDFNAGVNALGFDSVATGQGFIALAASTAFSAEFGALAETYYFSDAAPYTSKDSGFLFAFSHSPKPWLVFDVGANISYFTSTRLYSVFFGTTIVPISF